jgi:hypothetical protein
MSDENAETETETGTETSATDAGVSSRGAALRRHKVLVALAVLAAIIGAASSWKNNGGFRTRAANDSAVIRSGADLSSYVAPGIYTELTVPIRNDSPYAITIIGLSVPNAPRLAWHGSPVRVQPNATVYLRITTPSACAAVPHALKSSGPVTVAVRALTVDGKMHGSLRATENGVIQYAYDYCAVPTNSASVS